MRIIFIIIINLLLETFSHQGLLIVFYRSLSESQSPQVSRTLFVILANLNNAVVWVVSTCLVISLVLVLFRDFSSPCVIPLVTVPRAAITIGIIITFMFHSFFFKSIARSSYLSIVWHSFSFNL